MRAVLDTNVVISAAVTSGGVADRLLRLAALRRFTMIVSPKLLFEIQATAGKAYLAKQLPGGEDLAVFLAQIWRVGTPSIDPALRHPLTADDDRADDFVVALAQWNGALLVTGDSRLLKLDPHRASSRHASSSTCAKRGSDLEPIDDWFRFFARAWPAETRSGTAPRPPWEVQILYRPAAIWDNFRPLTSGDAVRAFFVR